MVRLYKKLCRYYFEIDPRATTSYVYAYRDMWDEEGQAKGEGRNLKYGYVNASGMGIRTNVIPYNFFPFNVIKNVQ